MEYIRVQDSFPKLSDTAVTLGKFDGIHRGHLKLIEKVAEQKEEGLTAVMFAVDINDRMILSRAERRDLLHELGIDLLLEARLDEKLRTMRAENFVREILVGDLGIRFLTVGEDYRFGYERKGDPLLLQRMGEKYGFEVRIFPREMDGRRKISSTYLREELRLGNMEKLTFLMGRDYFAEGTVLHGQGVGHRLLLPTINIVTEREKLLPPQGVYFTTTEFEDRCWQGISNIGSNPTVGGHEIRIETHLFDCDEDLYNRFCRIRFHHYARGEQKFPSLEALRGQLLRDVEAGRTYFREGP